MPQWIKDKLDTFPPGHLGRRYKIRITRNQHNDLGLALESNGGNVETDPHIDALLAQGWGKIVVGRILSSSTTGQKIFLRL